VHRKLVVNLLFFSTKTFFIVKETPLPGILERVAVTDIKNQVRVARRKYPTLDVKYIELTFQPESSTTSTTAKRSSATFLDSETEQTVTELEKETREVGEMGPGNRTDKTPGDLARGPKTSQSAADYDAVITGDGGEDHSGTADGDEDDTGVGGSLEEQHGRFETEHQKEHKIREMMDDPTQADLKTTSSMTPVENDNNKGFRKVPGHETNGATPNDGLEPLESTSIFPESTTQHGTSTERFPRAALPSDGGIFHNSGALKTPK
jgi:hypothetical protein